MSKAEPELKKPTDQQKPGWSPPHWLLKVLEKCWWLIGFEFLGLLGVILLYPLSQGFDGWWQNIQLQVAAVAMFPPTHPYLTAILAATLPLWIGVSYLAHQRLEKEELQHAAEGAVKQAVIELREELKPLIAVPLVNPSASPNQQEVSQAPEPEPHLPGKFLNVPPRNPYFTGRDELLERLHNTLQITQQATLTQTQAITGLGGIGKTQTALEYAYRYQQDYQTILWAQADTREALTSASLKLAELLGLPEREAQEQAVIVAALQHWLATHPHWLLILDNANDITLLGELLPRQVSGQVLLTARNPTTGTQARALPLETLPAEEGALLLLRRAKRLTPEEGLEAAPIEMLRQAKTLSEKLGGFPLALDQAGAYLEEHGCGVAEYQELFQTHRIALLDRRGHDAVGHVAPVTITVTLAVELVAQAHPAAAELLHLCAFLAPDAIAEEILTDGASQLGPVLRPALADAWQRNQAIEALLTYSLVRRDPDKQVLSIHRLVQAVLQDMMKRAEQLRWAVRAILAVNAAFPVAEYASWPQCERLLSQALAATELIKRYQVNRTEAGYLLYKTAVYLRDRARYGEAMPLFQQAVNIFKQQLGPEHIQVAISLNSLAVVYKEMGEITKAEPLITQALDIWKQQLGPEHTHVATALNNLGIIYMEQGKYSQAEELLQRALIMREQQLGPTHPDIAYPLYNLAMLYKKQENYAQAVQMYERALRILEQQLGPQHPYVARPLIGLADIYRKQGQTEHVQRGPMYREMEAKVGLYLEQGKHEESEQMNRDMYKKAFQVQQENYAQAVQMYERALRILEQQLGPQHLFTQRARASYQQFIDDDYDDESLLWTSG